MYPNYPPVQPTQQAPQPVQQPPTQPQGHQQPPTQQQPLAQQIPAQPLAQQYPVSQLQPAQYPVQQPAQQIPVSHQIPLQQPAQQQPAQQQSGYQQPSQQQPAQQMFQPVQQVGEGQQAQQLQPSAPVLSPLVDIYDSPEEFTIFADIPGALSESIHLEGEDRTLHIIAERQPDEDEDKLTPIQRERSPRVERTIKLPADVNVEEAEANCENGVCKVKLPKDKRRTIGVQ